MAQLLVGISIETDLVRDTINDLVEAHERLLSRHGDKFRVLQRQIEAVVSEAERGDLVWGPLTLKEIDDPEAMRFVVVPSGPIKALVDEARALGVL